MFVIFILISMGSMSHVDSNKWLRRPVEFKGQEPRVNRASVITTCQTNVCYMWIEATRECLG